MKRRHLGSAMACAQAPKRSCGRDERSRRTLPWLERIGCIALVVGILGLSGCGSKPEPESRPNIVLIVVDTLRADHLESYGHHRPTSPSIDAFAGSAIRFERAYSSAPWTKPAVASMFTGLHPSSHAVLGLERSLPQSATTLAERLRDAGYATGAVISHHLIGSEFGFDQGFSHFLEDQARGHRHLSTGPVTRQAEDLVDSLRSEGQPFFLFVHYFDPHFAYLRHPEYGFSSERPARIHWERGIAKLRVLDPPPDAEEIAYLESAYDEEVRYTDAGIGRLLDSLRARDLFDDALIVITSDHGEEFYEHGWLGHTIGVTEELVRVPLIIRLPGGLHRGKVIEEPVSLVSLGSTVLDIAGIAEQSESFPGGSLTHHWIGSETQENPPVFVEVDFEGRFKSALLTDRFGPNHQLAVVRGRHKLVMNKRTGDAVLFDVLRDPTEDHDIAAREPTVVAELLATAKRQLAEVATTTLPVDEQGLTAEQIETLHGLGYLEE
jgi:arylsulfatase A-like enzyme